VTILGRNAANAGIQQSMYQRRQSLLTLVLLSLPALGACEPLVQMAKERDAGVDENGATGGSTSTVGAIGGASTVAPGDVGGSSGSSALCRNVTPCGGNVVGTWTVTSSCLTVGGGLDLTMLGIGCTSVPVAGSLQVSGTFTAKSDGSFVDNTTTTGSEQFTLAPSCLQISGTTVTCDNIGVIFPAIGFASATCTSTGGGFCNCTGTVNQNGGIGLVDWNAATTGSYSTSSDVLKTTDGSSSWPYWYCASGNTLTMTPNTMSPTTAGKIELQKL